MSIVSSIIGGSVAKPIEAVGNVIDKLFTSDEERLDKKIIMERLSQNKDLAQIEVNKIEAAQKGFFTKWRPAIGWTCAAGIAYSCFLAAIIESIVKIFVPEYESAKIDTQTLIALVTTMLGSSGLRTYEKTKGIARQ